MAFDFSDWRGILRRRAENALAAMLATMFVAFLLQISFRYLLGLSTGWTNELSSVLWVWLVLFGAAFVVREEEEIRFDLVYAAVGAGARRAMALIAALALLLLYGVSLPATWDYVAFMKVERTAYLGIRFDWLFSIYLAFVVAILLRYFWIAWRALRGVPPGADRP